MQTKVSVMNRFFLIFASDSLQILRHICIYLDGFSLNNLSMTCHKLRDICSTLLTSRGIVVLQWERRSTSESNHKWVVGSKV